MGLELDYKMGIHCVVQWSMLSSHHPQGLCKFGKDKNRKLLSVHDVVNNAILNAFTRPLERTTRRRRAC